MNELTRANCETANRFHHKKIKNADGTPLRARRNGKTRLWKRKPDSFQIPCKYGLRDGFYISQNTAKDWEVVD